MFRFGTDSGHSTTQSAAALLHGGGCTLTGRCTSTSLVNTSVRSDNLHWLSLSSADFGIMHAGLSSRVTASAQAVFFFYIDFVQGGILEVVGC